MQKTFRVVVNRPTHFGNHCREGLVSPMTRSRVLSPEEAAILVVRECTDVQADDCLPGKGSGSIDVGEAPGRRRRCEGFPVFFIRPGGQVEAEGEEAVELEAPDPGYTVDPKLEADAQAARTRWMARARRGDWGSVKADLSVFEGLGVTIDPREDPSMRIRSLRDLVSGMPSVDLT